MPNQPKQKQQESPRVNDNRPNRKKWKKSHGNNPPVEQAKKDAETTRRKKATRK